VGKKAFFFGLFVALATAAPQNFFNPSNSSSWGNEFYASSFPEFLFDSPNDLAAFKFYVNSTVSPDSAWLYANRTPAGFMPVPPVYANVSIQGAGVTEPDGLLGLVLRLRKRFRERREQLLFQPATRFCFGGPVLVRR
jgi:hypothetical protein